jgi:hypothetical protein
MRKTKPLVNTIVLMMSLTIFISSDSFFLSRYLVDKISVKNVSDQEINQALLLNIPEAYQYKITQYTVGSNRWLYYARHLALSDGNTAVLIAQHYQNEENDAHAILWYQRAIKLNHSTASLQIASLYLMLSNIKAAEHSLSTIRDINFLDVKDTYTYLLLRVKIALAFGKIKDIHTYLPALLMTEKGRTFIQELVNYHVVSEQVINDMFANHKVINTKVNNAQVGSYRLSTPDLSNPQTGLAYDNRGQLLNTTRMFNRPTNSCNNPNNKPQKKVRASVQLFASDLKSLRKIDSFKKQLEKHPLAHALCLKPPKYLAPKTIDCENNPVSEKQTIECNESDWQKISATTDSRYIGLMLPSGGANVHLGILYVNTDDTFEVLTHELSHLVGFIDEYALPTNHQKCSADPVSASSLNVVVLKRFYSAFKRNETMPAMRVWLLAQLPWREHIKSTTPLFTPVSIQGEDSWLIGTPMLYSNEIGLFVTPSCTGDEYQSFKPLTKRSQLEYFEVDFPVEYMYWYDQPDNDFKMPSYHYNIAFAFFQQGEIIQAKRWLIKSSAFEFSPKKKKKVLSGNF